MNTSLPEGFLRRIRQYPKAVRAQLSGPLSDEAFSRTLRVLHGDEVDGDKKPKDHETMRFDVFLSRMMTSKKFEMRADSLIAFLSGNAAANKAQFDWESGLAFLGALANPAAAYLYKLREMERAPQADQAHLARLGPLMNLIEIFQIFGDRPEHVSDVDAIVADTVCKAAASGTPELLNIMLLAVGLDHSFTAKNQMEDEKPSATAPQGALACRGLAQHLIAEAGLRTGLSGAGAHVLKTLEAVGARKAMENREVLARDQKTVLTLSARRPLHIALLGPITEGDIAYWTRQADEGWIAAWSQKAKQSPEAALEELAGSEEALEEAGSVLILPAYIHVPCLALALMQCFEMPPLLRAQLERQGNTGSWAAQITGFDDKQSSFQDVGYLWRRDMPHGETTQVPTLPLMPVEPGPDGSSQPSASVTRETAFALVLRLPGAPPVSTYVNSECCLVFETIEALLGRTNLSTPVEEDKEHWEHQEEGQKPVVILGPDTPRDPRYIISSVQKFWSFSGRYITGFADPAYDSIAGNFAPRFAADGDAKLCRVLTTDLATVPLDLFQSAGATLCDQITGPQALGYIISPDAFAVRLANEGLISSALQQRLPRITEKSKLTPGDREALSMAGQVTAHYVQQHELGRHWPLDRLLALHLYARDTLALACRAFMNQPSAETARKVLHTLKLEPELVLTMGTDIGGFALALAARVDVFLALESADRQLYLKTLRNLDVADDVAWHLACNVREICDVAPREIVALFEFLSCCLSSEQVSEILVGAALGSTAKSRRIPYRLAECLRRYGTSLSSIMYLKKLQQEASPSLEDPSFLRSFSPLLRLGSRDYATDILGKALMQGIAAAEPFSLGFQEALASGDRDAALSAMSEMVALDTGEVMKWLDQMRSYSAVLEAMDLPLSAISSPAMERVFVRKKAAVIFSDMAVLKELKSGSILDVQQDADAVGLSFLGDHAALDAIIKKQSALGSVAAFELRGSTVHEVFAHASAMTATREPASQDGPLVSVIVSAFNPDIELMRLALNSITGQSHGNFEIFVVDDASEAPHSAEIAALCTQYESVHYHRMVRNSGPYAGRNYALSRAKGDYFAIQDADDWSHPARFAQQVAALEADPLLQMVTTPHIRIDHNGRVQLEAGFQVLGDGPMTSMFRRAALVALGGFASTRSRGDVEMRERMRAYFGSHALTELAAPIALCLGDRQTLSQRVIDRSSHHLRAFRQHIDSQHLLRHARRDFGIGESLYRPLVPYDLRTSEVADTQ